RSGSSSSRYWPLSCCAWWNGPSRRRTRSSGNSSTAAAERMVAVEHASTSASQIRAEPASSRPVARTRLASPRSRDAAFETGSDESSLEITRSIIDRTLRLERFRHQCQTLDRCEPPLRGGVGRHPRYLIHRTQYLRPGEALRRRRGITAINPASRVELLPRPFREDGIVLQLGGVGREARVTLLER